MEESIKNHLDSLFWTLVLQAVLFITLGVLIWMYPTLLVAIVVVGMFVVGASTLVLAVRVRSFRRKVLDKLPT